MASLATQQEFLSNFSILCQTLFLHYIHENLIQNYRIQCRKVGPEHIKTCTPLVMFDRKTIVQMLFRLSADIFLENVQRPDFLPKALYRTDMF